MKIIRKLLINCVIFLFCIAVSYPLLAQENLPAIIKKIQPSVLTILTYDKNGKDLAQGSGFFIRNNGDVITNRHVLEGASSADVKTAQGKVYPITRVVAEDTEGDLILVSVNIPPDAVYPLLVSASIPEVGERVIVIGSPLRLEKTVSDGIVSAVREIPQFGKIIQITAPISPGSSGSPVVNMKGEVIGVATLQAVEGQNLNFAISSVRVAKLVPGKGQTLTQYTADRAKKGGDSAEGLYNTGHALIWAGDNEKALIYFEKAIKKDPHFAEAYLGIGACNLKLGRYQKVIEPVKQAIRIKPDDIKAYALLGLAYFLLGRYEEAIEPFKQTIRIEPNSDEYYVILGKSYIYLGRYQEALETLKQAIRIKPDYAEAHCDLGLTYGMLGRYQEAIEALKQAIRIKPDNARAHFGLGAAYLSVGDKGSALDEYKILKTLNQDLATELFNQIYK
jgi:tetratricopeptide (TPR) repeat protein